MCDLGDRINLIPLSLFKKMTLSNPQPTSIMLQFAYKSLTRPKGITKDILMQIESLIFSVYFISHDFEPNFKVSFILEHPFLDTTGKIIIDMVAAKLIVEVCGKS